MGEREIFQFSNTAFQLELDTGILERDTAELYNVSAYPDMDKQTTSDAGSSSFQVENTFTHFVQIFQLCGATLERGKSLISLRNLAFSGWIFQFSNFLKRTWGVRHRSSPLRSAKQRDAWSRSYKKTSDREMFIFQYIGILEKSTVFPL